MTDVDSTASGPARACAETYTLDVCGKKRTTNMTWVHDQRLSRTENEPVLMEVVGPVLQAIVKVKGALEAVEANKKSCGRLAAQWARMDEGLRKQTLVCA